MRIIDKIVIMVVLVMFMAVPSVLGASADEIQQLEKQIDVLKQQIDGLEKAQKQDSYIDDDIEEIFDRLNEVETKSLVDKVSISGDLRVRFDWFNYSDQGSWVTSALYPSSRQYITATVGTSTLYNENPSYDPLTKLSIPFAMNGVNYFNNLTSGHETVRALPSTRFRLSLKSDISDDLIFRGRLAMYKNWGDNDIPIYEESTSGRKPGDTSIKVERAYVDYFFGPEWLPMALTFGRLPVSDSMPTGLREDTPRKSTYPGLAYDVEQDGAALSFGLEKLLHLPAASFKLLGGKILWDNDALMYREDTSGARSANVYVAQLETRLPGDFLKDTIVLFNYVSLPKVAPLGASGQDLMPVYLPHRLALQRRGVFFVESKDFLGSGVDWFASYASVRTLARGLAYYNASGVSVATGGLNLDGLTNTRAHAHHVGARITLPVAAINNPKIGIENNYGSKYWAGFNAGAEGRLDKLNIRGGVWDFYYIQPVNDNMSLRFGYTRVRQKYQNGGFFATFINGVPYECKRVIRNSYCLMDINF